MKTTAIFLLSLIFSAMVFAQNQSGSVTTENEVTLPKFTGIEKPATDLKTGPSNLINNYLKKHIVCPAKAADCCIEGTEIVRFTVTPSGEVTEFEVINSVCPDLDDEVIRVLKTTSGMWEPGLKNGRPAPVSNEVVFMFADYKSQEVVKYFTNTATRLYKAGSAKLFEKRKPQKALAYLNKGIRYMPNDKCLLLLRGLCQYELGETESAQRDWNRIAALGGVKPEEVDSQLTTLKGYPEMVEIISAQ